MANKKTQRDYFNEIIALAQANGRDDLVEFCEGRIDVLNRKSSSKKPTAMQVQNEEFKAEILNVLEGVDKITCSEVIKLSDKFEDMSTPKMSALLNALVKDEKVVKTIDKKKSYFSLA